MALVRFALPLDLAGLGYHTGGLLRLLAATLVVPVGVALLSRELPQAGLFATMAALSWAVGWALRRHGAQQLGLREALALTALAYLLFATVGAVAFVPVAGPADAFFEAMSGFTTTGLTVMPVDELPRSLLFFRGYSQWLGGAGIIVLTLVVLAEPGSTGKQLYTAEFGQENLLGSVVSTGRVVMVAYAGLTVAGVLGLWAAGAGFFDAVVHGLSLTSTGGFSPFTDSFGAYDRGAVAGVAGGFMVLGATSLPLLYMTRHRGPRRLLADSQLRLLVALVLAAAVVFLLFEGPELDELGAAAFHATTAVTTTGFVLEPVSEWSEGARMLALGLMVVGGSVGSTAGGIKLLRLLILVRTVGWSVSRTLLPEEAKMPLTVEHAVVGPEEIRRTFALLGAYLVLLFLGAVAVTGAGVPMENALFDVASALSTVGLSTGATSADLPAWAKLVLALMMWAGRVEIVAVLVLLHPMNWLRK